jgi:hypothetical protein
MTCSTYVLLVPGTSLHYAGRDVALPWGDNGHDFCRGILVRRQLGGRTHQAKLDWATCVLLQEGRVLEQKRGTASQNQKQLDPTGLHMQKYEGCRVCVRLGNINSAATLINALLALGFAT